MSEWISAKTKLPKSKQYVLVCSDCDDEWQYHFAQYQRKEFWDLHDQNRICGLHVDYWMLLPEPPK